MAADRVYFKFAGDDSGEIPSRIVEITRRDLQAKPNSLLTVLANDLWNKGDRSLGSMETNPIVTKPLESVEDSWHPNMASTISYLYESDHQEPLLPEHVELEELLTILDYYGLSVDDPRNIDITGTDLQTRLRAQMFLDHSEDYATCLRSMFSKMEERPVVAKRTFIFVNSHHEMSYINEESKEIYTPVIVPSRNRNFEWIKRTRLRKQLLVDLKAEGYSASCCENRSVTVSGPSRENAFDDREFRRDPLCVVTVAIPEPGPVAKRQRL